MKSRCPTCSGEGEVDASEILRKTLEEKNVFKTGKDGVEYLEQECPFCELLRLAEKQNQEKGIHVPTYPLTEWVPQGATITPYKITYTVTSGTTSTFPLQYTVTYHTEV